MASRCQKVGIRTLGILALGWSLTLTTSTPARATEVRLRRVPEGGIQPQVAVDAAGVVHLIYFKGPAASGDIYYVRQAPGAKTFTAPLRVNSQAGSAIAIGSIRGAQLALGKKNRVHIVWNGSARAEPLDAGKQMNPLLFTRMTDDGTSFEPQKNIIATAFGLDGGGSVAADQAGMVYVAWHANPERTGEAERHVYMARSRDEGKTFQAERAIDTQAQGACSCCALKAGTDSQGALYVFYRSARQGVNRDMRLLTSLDQGNTFRALEVSRWQAAVCPMSSEALLEIPGGVIVAWEANGEVLFSRVTSRPNKRYTAVAAPGGSAGRKHPAVARNLRNEILLAWDKGTGWQKGGSLGWQLFDEQGNPRNVHGKAEGIPVWSFPAVYAEPEGTFVIVY